MKWQNRRVVMGILNKLASLTRGAARESAEVLIDANAIRIFEQEIVDVEAAIGARKQTMSEMLVARKQVDREIESVEEVIKKREEQASELLSGESNAQLVEEIADDIVQYETMLVDLKQQSNTMAIRISRIEATLRKGLSQVTQYRRDLRLMKAKQINSSILAKESNLPKQLSELQHTRQHVADLQSGDDDRESVWEEMEGRISTEDTSKKLSDLEKEKKKQAVLARIKKISS